MGVRWLCVVCVEISAALSNVQDMFFLFWLFVSQRSTLFRSLSGAFVPCLVLCRGTHSSVYTPHVLYCRVVCLSFASLSLDAPRRVPSRVGARPLVSLPRACVAWRCGSCVRSTRSVSRVWAWGRARVCGERKEEILFIIVSPYRNLFCWEKIRENAGHCPVAVTLAKSAESRPGCHATRLEWMQSNGGGFIPAREAGA